MSFDWIKYKLQILYHCHVFDSLASLCFYMTVFNFLLCYAFYYVVLCKTFIIFLCELIF